MDKGLVITTDVNTIVKAIKSKKIVDFFQVPDEMRDNPEIVRIERKMKIRSTDTRGFDVLKQVFFVNEIVNTISTNTGEVRQRERSSFFETFETFYSFLEGDIYDNACYYGYHFSEETIEQYKIKTEELNVRAFVNDAVNSSFIRAIEDEDSYFEITEKKKSILKRWIEKYNACNSYEELISVNESHRKSSDDTDEIFYIMNYMNAKGEAAFDILMQFVNKGYYPAYLVEEVIPFIYDMQRVAETYNYANGSKATCYRYKSKYKAYLKRISQEYITTETSKYFDKKTHFYCIRTDYYFDNVPKMRLPCASHYRYFEDFNAFAKFLDKDLSNCDLSAARGIVIDASYKLNEKTKLPIEDINTLKKKVRKEFDRYRDSFTVSSEWTNSFGEVVYRETNDFKYFFDFLAYLENDLSDADLLHCDGLVNLPDYSNINFNGAKMTSEVLDSIGIHYDSINLIKMFPEEYINILQNEKETALILDNEHIEIAEPVNGEFYDNKVYYISDIHLVHKVIRKHAKTTEDIAYLIEKIIDDMLRDIKADVFGDAKTLLIGGDVSSEYALFEMFVKLLRKTICKCHYDIMVIFILGNHELWNQEEKNVDEIVQRYRTLITENDMYLLNNEILFIENQDNVSYISEKDILQLEAEAIQTKVRKARMVIFGGVGFAGCNEEFNANSGIYRGTIDRDEEIRLSSEFETLYGRVVDALGDKNIIIFTHMNINEWKKDCELHDNYIYVSGHSHSNMYYDDGVRRLYADNQVGYYNDKPRLKYFLIDNTYDWFLHYEDGIYEISRDDYIEFYRGKNIRITYNRNAVKLYMLKKHGYYCFIQENKSGNLSILNGGALKALLYKDIEYYYQNMDAEILYIKTPLIKYQKLQEQIADEIRRIGGSGRIHGAIIDIDGNEGSIAYNHLYFNPMDLTITPYYAIDMVFKYVYPSFPALISHECPKLFERYKNLLATEKDGIIIKPVDKAELMVKPILYTSTDIYKASRELRKMQKINSNILSTWYDGIPNLQLLDKK